MAPARTLPSWVVLDRHVLIGEEVDVKAEPQWETLRCGSRRSYGCGRDGDSVVEGVTLLALVAHPPGLSALGLRVTDALVKEKGLWVYSQVLATEKNLVVLSLVFPSYHLHNYYLIYDTLDTSLTMIPHLTLSDPEISALTPAFTVRPLPIPRDDGSYVLVHAAKYLCYDWENKAYCTRDLLCLWPPSPSWSSSQSSSSSSASSSCSDLRWQSKEPIFPKEMPSPRMEGFEAHEVFSFNGMVLWADLHLGVLYCKQEDLLSDECDSVQFHFLHLPPACRPDPIRATSGDERFRTMGCVGGSIQFVSIHGYHEFDKQAPEDRKAAVWSLTWDLQEWKKNSEIRMGDLWEQEEFKKAKLPTSMPLLNPVLSAHEDGILYAIVRDYYLDDEGCWHCNEKHILRVDMPSQSLVSSKRLPSWDHMYNPRVFVSDFMHYIKIECLGPFVGLLKRKLSCN